MLNQPSSIYINWGAYDELSDTIELTETLAMRQLDELLRLRDLGVRFDSYIMDCFWFAVDKGFREWRKPHWPDGPDKWLDRCLKNDVKPGLWFPVNAMVHPIPEMRLRAIPEWYDSLDGTPQQSWTMCLFYGGFLPHLMESLHQWYERGVRLYKFDFANFDSAPPHLKEVMLPREIRAANFAAFQGALKAFRKSHPAATILAYNGFEEAGIMGGTTAPFRKTLDSHWLESFDALYCGDPRPADVPAMNFWRSKDVYSDHMARYFEFNQIPLRYIDNTSFMIGLTGTCYYRGTAAWKGMLLLSLARGGWANTYYGNLELLDTDKATWFGKAQKLFYPFQHRDACSTFGEIPGSGLPYGFLASDENGGVITVVNPSQEILSVKIPAQGETRLLFRDAGFEPQLQQGTITLGPEQMALVGYGTYANETFDLGIQDDVIIPKAIEKLEATFAADGDKSILGAITNPGGSHLRIIFRQTDKQGVAKRTSGGSAAGGKKMGEILKIEATQGEKKIPVSINYDKAIWSGLSWAVGEISTDSFDARQPLTIRCTTTEPEAVRLTCDLHRVTY